MTPRPHDALFKSAFEAPANAAALLREVLPAELREAIAWETVRGESGSYVDPALADSHSDLLFSASLRSGIEPQLHLLLEHQSTEDPAMPLRALSYQVRIWERCHAEKPAAQLPPILAVVVSHVPGGWTSARTLEDMFERSLRATPGLAALVPRFSLVIEDLAHLSNDELKARSLAPFQKLALWLLRDARDPERFLASFDTWISTMMQLLGTPSGIHAFDTLVIYMFRIIDPVNRGDLHAKLRRMGHHAQRTAMNYADWLHEEGRAQGRQEGRVAALRSLLVLKFKLQALGPDYESRLQAASPEAVDRYLQRVLTTDSLGAVFDD